MLDSYLLYTQKLEGEYKETFQKIDMYVGANHIDEQSKEEMMSNLLDIFLNAQEEGRPIEKITGKNIEQFCKSFCSGYGFKEQMISFLDSIGGWLIMLFVLSAIDMAIFFLEYLEGADVNFFTYKTEFPLAAYALFLIAIYFINVISSFVVRRIMFRCKKIMRKLLAAVRVVVLLIPVIAFLVLIEDFKTTVMPTWICFVGFGVLTIVYRLVTRERRRRKRENKISFWDYYKTQGNENNNLAIERKKFFKHNQKRIKKGLIPLTKEEYLKSELKKIKLFNKPYIYIVIPVAIIIFMVIWMCCTNQFETFMDLAVFVIVIAIVEGILMSVCWKFTNGATEYYIACMEKELENPQSWEE